MDDIFVIWIHGWHILNTIMDYLNIIKFTISREKKLINSNFLKSNVHKPKQIWVYLNFHSNHGSSTNTGIKKLFDRVKSICSNRDFSESLMRILHQYRLRIVKDKSCTSSNNYIYSVSCDCGIMYVGETERPWEERIKKHEDATLRLELPE